MKLMKKLLVLAAAMTMVLSLVACGGEKFPQTYLDKQARGQGEQTMEITLEEDGTYKWTFFATESNGSGNKVMECEMTGTYKLEENTITIETAEGKGYYVAGTSKTEFTFSKDEPGMYVNTNALGAFVFTIDGETFAPVVE